MSLRAYLERHQALQASDLLAGLERLDVGTATPVELNRARSVLANARQTRVRILAGDGAALSEEAQV